MRPSQSRAIPPILVQEGDGVLGIALGGHPADRFELCRKGVQRGLIREEDGPGAACGADGAIAVSRFALCQGALLVAGEIQGVLGGGVGGVQLDVQAGVSLREQVEPAAGVILVQGVVGIL